MKSLTFTVPGRVPTNNLNARYGRGHHYKNPKSIEFGDITWASALEVAQQQGWKPPQCCRIRIDCFNTSIDADNVCKAPQDSLRGKIIVDDNRKHLRGITVEHCEDAGPPRLVVTITECEMLRSEAVRKVRNPKPRQRTPKKVHWPDVVAEAKRREATKPKPVADILRETKQGGRVTFTVLDELKRTGVLRNGKSVH